MPRYTDVEFIERCISSTTMNTNPDNFDGHEEFISKIEAHDGYGKWQFANGFNTALVSVKVALNKAPDIDAVEVVRCKDCIKQQKCNFAQYQGLNGYCSLGEKGE